MLDLGCVLNSNDWKHYLDFGRKGHEESSGTMAFDIPCTDRDALRIDCRHTCARMARQQDILILFEILQSKSCSERKREMPF